MEKDEKLSYDAYFTHLEHLIWLWKHFGNKIFKTGSMLSCEELGKKSPNSKLNVACKKLQRKLISYP